MFTVRTPAGIATALHRADALALARILRGTVVARTVRTRRTR